MIKYYGILVFVQPWIVELGECVHYALNIMIFISKDFKPKDC